VNSITNKKGSYQIDLVPELISLKSNVRRIPYFHILSGIPKTQDLFKSPSTKLEIEFIVGNIESPIKKSGGKIYAAVDENTLYFEYPIGLNIVPKMLLEFKENSIKMTVNRTYYKLGRININQLYSPGWHLIDTLDLTLLNNSYSLLHGAAFVYKNKTVLLIALSDTGKTRTTLSFVTKHGAKYIGEDMLATDGDNLFSCPYGISHLHADLMKLGTSWSIYEKIYAHFPGLDILGRKPIKSILDVISRDNLCLQSKVDYIFVIRKGEKNIAPLKADIAEKMILASNKAEFRYSTNPMLMSAQMMGIVDVFGAMEKERNLVNKLVNNSKLYYLIGDTDYFIEAIRNVVSSS
jgi:hypothetical protein